MVQSTDQQREAAAKLIQKLDLCQEVQESDDEVPVIEEKLEPEKTFNPTIQYFNQVVTHKVVNPQQANQIPEQNQNILEYLQPDAEVQEEAQKEIEEFENAFELVANEEEDGKEKTQKQRIYWRDIIETEERRMAEENKRHQLQVVEEEAKVPLTEQEAARLKEFGPKDDGDDAIKQIGSVKPIDDFKQMVSDRKVDRVQDALRQMQSIIERYIRCSLNGDLYEKAFDCL